MAEAAAEKYAVQIKDVSKILRESQLTSGCYYKIHRLHDDKIGAKGIASEIGCTVKEVTAAIWKPTAASAFNLFKQSEGVRAKSASAGVSFTERARLIGNWWDEAKRNGQSAPFEMQAIEEKHALALQLEKWNDFLQEWLDSRQTAPAPAASRERPKPVPIVKKKVSNPQKPREATVVQLRNRELKVAAEVAAERRARWFEKNWEHVQPFLPPASQDIGSDFARKVLRKSVAAATSGEKQRSAQLLDVQPQPRSIKTGDGGLYPYQLEGMTWMLNQHRQGVGGILGDEMGLGKTLQVISFIAALHDSGEVGPHLIVAPLSVLPTWEREFQRWCPALKAVQFHGNEKARKDLWRDYLSTTSDTHFDVVLTTYEMLTAATSMLTHRMYNYVILDEAQRIKNEESQISQAVRKLRCVYKLLITGTPLQNDLHELWSLLNFLFPDIFASSEQFDLAFQRGFTSTRVDLDLVCAAHKLLEPLMLRRLKKDVQKHLPKKTVLTIWCPITDMQRFWYKRCLEASGCAKDLLLYRPGEAGSGAASGSSSAGHGAKNKLMNLLMQLRKVVNHPYMFSEADLNPHETDESIVTNSSKMMVLDRLLNKCKAEGRRVLVYSQFTTMLDVIQDYCNLVGHGFMRLDGNTCLARRKYEIKMFNSKRGNQFVYLLSTRAGALGITLTGADTVIMYDSDWNPTWDKQAHDRVHRIGQDKEVTIYQLLCKDTVEQRMFQRAAQKTSLNELVLRDDTESKSADKEDVLSSGEVQKMLRCGVVKILDGESTVMTEESVDQLIAAAHARGEQEISVDDEEGADDLEAVDVFNQRLAEVRAFGGKKFETNREAMRSIADEWVAELAASGARRERISTVENVGGYQVKKINRSAAGPVPPQSNEKKKNPVVHDDKCLYCGERGAQIHSELSFCKSGHCHRAFHEPCLDSYLQRENKGKKSPQEKTVLLGGLGCTQHQCSLCLAKAAGRGGVIFRCWKCPLAFCGDCLPDEYEPLDVRSGDLIDKVQYLASSVEYLVCSGCTRGTTRKLSRAAAYGAPRPVAIKRSMPESGKETSKLARKKHQPQRQVPNLQRSPTRVKPPPFQSTSKRSNDVNMGESWHTKGPYMHQRVRRTVTDSAGTPIGFADGTVVGHLPLEVADYISELTGRPAALWHVSFDDAAMGSEDLEEVEVQDAIESYKMKSFQMASPSKKAKSPQSKGTKREDVNGKQPEIMCLDSDNEADSPSYPLPKPTSVLEEVGGALLSSRETPVRSVSKSNSNHPDAAMRLAVAALGSPAQADKL